MRRFLRPRLRLLHLVLALVFYPMADPEPLHAAAGSGTAQAVEPQLPVFVDQTLPGAAPLRDATPSGDLVSKIERFQPAEPSGR
jgi:hypothetical protein